MRELSCLGNDTLAELLGPWDFERSTLGMDSVPPSPATFTQPGRFKSVGEFQAAMLAMGLPIQCDEAVLGQAGPLGQPIEVYGHLLRNRFAIHPMEGWDASSDGRPSDWTRRRWRRFGRSGAKLIWGGEAFAVREDGRANPRQLYLNPAGDAVSDLTSLREELRAGHVEVGEDPDELFVGLQLTHSGRWSCPSEAGPSPRIAYHHPILDARVGLSASDPVLSDDELREIIQSYIAAAVSASAAGFQFVDIKCCHGYLLHELLGAKTRDGEFGGDFENRSRFFREVVEGIRSACPGLHIGTRISVCDSVPFARHADNGVGVPEGMDHRPWNFGFGIDSQDPRLPDFTDAEQFLGLCQQLGVTLINATAGSPYYCPHLQRPAAHPPSDGYLPPEDPMIGVAYHLDAVRRCKLAFPDMVFVGTGYSYLQEFLPGVAQHEIAAGHVDIVGIGRMVLSYPELPLDVMKGAILARKRICRTLSDCTTSARQGKISGCYPLDPDYKKLR
jgi:NADPH2 dehydrogenase